MPDSRPGPHSAVARLEYIQLSHDGTKVLFTHKEGFSAWDTRTGEYVTSSIFNWSAMPDSPRIFADPDFRWVFQPDQQGGYLAEIGSPGRARHFPVALTRISHTGKGIKSEWDGKKLAETGADLTSGQTVALTDIDRALPVDDGIHFAYEKGKKIMDYNRETKQTKERPKGVYPLGHQDRETPMQVGGHLVRVNGDSDELIVQDKANAVVSRTPLLNTSNPGFSFSRFVPPGGEPSVVVVETTWKNHKGFKAVQS